MPGERAAGAEPQGPGDSSRSPEAGAQKAGEPRGLLAAAVAGGTSVLAAEPSLRRLWLAWLPSGVRTLLIGARQPAHQRAGSQGQLPSCPVTIFPQMPTVRP